MSLAVAVSGFVGQLAGYSVVSYIRYNGGVDAVGIYQAGYTIIVKYVGIILTALAVEYFPRITSRQSGRKSIEVIMRHECMVFMPIVTSAAVLLALFAPETVAILYAPGFISAADMVWCALPSLSVRVLSWNLAFIVLAKGSPLLFMTMECIGAAIMAGSIISGYVFGGIAGAGVGVALDGIIYMAMVYIIVRSRYGITPGRRLWVATAISFIAIMAAVAVRMF